MRTHVISKKPAVLDWATIPAASIDNLLWSPQVEISAKAQICYDEEALYVRLSAKEANIRAEETGPLGSPCLDSCLEFFFAPNPEELRYFNFEYNPNCCLYLGLGNEKADTLYRLIADGSDCFGAVSERTEDGWNITYTIPYSFIRHFFPDFAPTSGFQMRGNFYKCGDLTEQEHYLAWNPMTCDTPAFHRPWEFGMLIFE